MCVHVCVYMDSAVHVFVPVRSAEPSAGQGPGRGCGALLPVAADGPERGQVGSPALCPNPNPAGPGRKRSGSRQMEHKARNRAGERAGGKGELAKLPGPLIHKIHKSSGMNNNRKKQ